MTPTRDQIHSELHELESKRVALALKRAECQDELSKLNFRIRTGGKLPDHEYKKICLNQQRIKSVLRDMDEQLAPINRRLREIGQWIQADNKSRASTYAEIRSESQDTIATQERLIGLVNELRHKYREFAKYPTRVASMRLMATAFAVELQAVIKQCS